MGWDWVIENVIAQGSKPPIGARLQPPFNTLVLCAVELLVQGEYSPREYARYPDGAPLPMALPGAFPNMHVIKCGIDDARPTIIEIRKVMDAANECAIRIRRSEKILITCQQGRNRSGLVVAFTLLNLGHKTQWVINTIKAKRKDALTNPDFVKAIRAYGNLRQP